MSDNITWLGTTENMLASFEGRYKTVPFHVPCCSDQSSKSIDISVCYITGGIKLGKSTYIDDLLSLTTDAHKISKLLKKNASEECIPIDEKRLQKAITIVNKQKNSIQSQAILFTSPVPDKFERVLIGEYTRRPVPNLLTSLIGLSVEEVQKRLQAKRIYEAAKACLKALKYLLALIRLLLGIRLTDALVSALHRIFYIPYSTLHMPKDTDEDSSNASRFEQINRAITGIMPCLPLSS